MDHDRDEPKERRPARSPLLRALIDHVRGRVEARRRRIEFEQCLQNAPDAMILREDVRARWAEISQGLHVPGEPLVFTEEGAREVEEEMARPPLDTPGRRALFERVRVRAAMRARAEMGGTISQA